MALGGSRKKIIALCRFPSGFLSFSFELFMWYSTCQLYFKSFFFLLSFNLIFWRKHFSRCVYVCICICLLTWSFLITFSIFFSFTIDVILTRDTLDCMLLGRKIWIEISLWWSTFFRAKGLTLAAGRFNVQRENECIWGEGTSVTEEVVWFSSDKISCCLDQLGEACISFLFWHGLWLFWFMRILPVLDLTDNSLIILLKW